LGNIEPQLRWALHQIRNAVVAGREPGVNWVELTDHLSAWDRGDATRLHRDVRDLWAEYYLLAAQPFPSNSSLYVNDVNAGDDELPASE
jgi:hypothetical protein